MNTALRLLPAQFKFLKVDVRPPLLVLHATDGTKIADPTCISGYVWRTVRADDLVCVEPSVRAQVRADNAAVAERRIAQPNRVQLQMCSMGSIAIGSSGNQDEACLAAAYKIACKPGFVWREAVADDYVCVTPETRRQARDDNSWAARRRVDYEEVLH